MDPAAINWQELTATVAILGVFVWGITKGLPNLIKSFAEESEKQRTAFSDALVDQRKEFREDLAATREQSRVLAQSGHNAVSKMSSSVEQLSEKIENLPARLAD